jgi:hypothetical protein
MGQFLTQMSCSPLLSIIRHSAGQIAVGALGALDATKLSLRITRSPSVIYRFFFCCIAKRFEKTRGRIVTCTHHGRLYLSAICKSLSS